MARTIRALALTTLGGLGAALGCSGAGNLGGNLHPDAAQTTAFAGTWDGYAEATTFQPSGTDEVHLVLDAQGNGTLQVGNDPLLPAPTDPNVGFPPSVSIDAKTTGAEAPNDLQGGVLYPVYATQTDASRIQFGLKPLDYYAAWCGLQTPHDVLQGYTSVNNGTSPVDGGLYAEYAYSILPGSGGGAGEDSSGNWTCDVQINAADGSYTQQPVDCGKFYLGVEGVCACTASSCSAAPAVAQGTAPTGYPAELDGTLDSSGKELTGTLVIGGTRAAVHLTRK